MEQIQKTLVRTISNEYVVIISFVNIIDLSLCYSSLYLVAAKTSLLEDLLMLVKTLPMNKYSLRRWVDMVLTILRSAQPNIPIPTIETVLEIMEYIELNIRTRNLVFDDIKTTMDIVEVLTQIAQQLNALEVTGTDKRDIPSFSLVDSNYYNKREATTLNQVMDRFLAIVGKITATLVNAMASMEDSLSSDTAAFKKKDSGSIEGTALIIGTDAGVSLPVGSNLVSNLNSSSDISEGMGLAIVKWTVSPFPSPTDLLGDVLSITLTGSDGKELVIRDVSPPMLITIPRSNNLVPPKCVFYNLGTKEWSGEGCK